MTENINKEDREDLSFLNFYVKDNFKDLEILNKSCAIKNGLNFIYNDSEIIIGKECGEIFVTNIAKLDNFNSTGFVYSHDIKDSKYHENFVEFDDNLKRASEVPALQGDYSKINRVLGWRPETTFKGLVELMMEHDMGLAAKETNIFERQ